MPASQPRVRSARSEPEAIPARRYGPPKPRPSLPRPELYTRLDRATQSSLTVITGPPGAGKTMLLSGWVKHRELQARVAWLTLQRADGRPARFWTLFLAALGETVGDQRPPFPDPADGTDAMFLEAVAAALDTLCAPALVVLDDFEQLRSRPVTEGLDQLLRRCRSLTLVIASRSDPGLSLQRLRLEGRLAELRFTDLAFSREETGKLFALAGLDLGAEQTDRLHERTEGWAGGLGLAALSLRDHPDPHGFVSTFAGDQRTVADYLVEEVLHQQPPDLCEFMLRTSVVDSLDADMADALTGRCDSARILWQLARSNAFVVATDEQHDVYRYHPMFAELLRSQLRHRMPDAVALAHRRAARRCAVRGEPRGAINHALRADDLQMAAELLADRWITLIVNGEADAVLEWAAGLPQSATAANAELAVAVAGAALDMGDIDRADGYLRLADARACTVPAKRRTQYALCRTIAEMMRSRLLAAFDRTRSLARKVLLGHQVAGGSPDCRGLALLHLSVAERWLGLSEHDADGLEEALELARRSGCDYLALSCLSQLALFAALDGGLRAADAYAQAALRIALPSGWEERAFIAPAYFALAVADFQWAEPARASDRLGRAERAAGRSHERTTRCLINLLRAQLLARSDIREAVRVAHASHVDAGAWSMPDRLLIGAEFIYAGLLAEAGEPERARAGLPDCERQPDGPEFALIRARLDLAEGQPAQAARRLHREPAARRRAPAPSIEIESLAVEALAKHQLHDDEAALGLVEAALARAQPDGYRQPLLAVGPALRELLKRRVRAGTAQRTLAGELIDSFDQQPLDGAATSRRVLLDPLSEREAAVLRYLPTVMSKAEIASELFVSVNTVKTHTKNIYRKLGVTTRNDAVRQARSLHLC